MFTLFTVMLPPQANGLDGRPVGNTFSPAQPDETQPGWVVQPMIW